MTKSFKQQGNDNIQTFLQNPPNRTDRPAAAGGFVWVKDDNDEENGQDKTIL